MVDVIQIPNLPAATSLSGAELIEVVQGGVSSRATIAQINENSGAFFNVLAYGPKGDGVSDDTASIQSAIDAASLVFGTVFFPSTQDYYLSQDGNISVPTGVSLLGFSSGSLIKIGTTTLNPLFDCGDSSDVSFSGLFLRGNKATQTSSSSGSSAIKWTSGAARVLVKNCDIRDFTRHLIEMDGVSDAVVSQNYLSGTYHGAGVLCSRTTASTNVTVINNTVKNTQLGNIQAFVGMTSWKVIGNYCCATGVGSGSTADGEIADNITSYNAACVDLLILGNTCEASGNNGIHVGGDRVSLDGNTVIDPLYIGIAVWKTPNSLPTMAANVRVTNNYVKGTVRNDSNKQGISVRQCLGGVVSGNTIDTNYSGIDLYAFTGTGNGLLNFSITGNYTINTSISIRCRKRVTGAVISSNNMRNSTVGVLLGNDTSDGFSNPSQFNLVASNMFRDVTGDYVQEQTSGDYNTIRTNMVTGATSAGTITLVGANSTDSGDVIFLV